MEDGEITDAVIVALKEAFAARDAQETPRETALRLLNQHGVRPSASAAQPVEAGAYHDLDEDL